MKGLSITVVLGCTGAAAVAQTDMLYALDSFGSGRLYALQGFSVTNSAPFAGGSGESAIAVYGDVRTSAYGTGGGAGAQYDLGLNWTGTTYPFTGSDGRYDGATDGKYNYAFAYPGSTMNRYDRDWQNETFVCNVPNTDMAGITYDGSNGTFWGVSLVSVPTTIINFDASGTVLSSFLTSSSTGFSYQYGIAWEPSTDTLWTIEYAPSGSPELWQYDKTGAVLQHAPVAGLSDAEWGLVGVEFDMVPAPGSLALLGLGGLAASRRRRM